MANRTKCPDCGNQANVTRDGKLGYHTTLTDQRPCTAVGDGPPKKKAPRKKAAKK